MYVELSSSCNQIPGELLHRSDQFLESSVTVERVLFWNTVSESRAVVSFMEAGWHAFEQWRAALSGGVFGYVGEGVLGGLQSAMWWASRLLTHLAGPVVGSFANIVLHHGWLLARNTFLFLVLPLSFAGPVTRGTVTVFLKSVLFVLHFGSRVLAILAARRDDAALQAMNSEEEVQAAVEAGRVSQWQVWKRDHGAGVNGRWAYFADIMREAWAAEMIPAEGEDGEGQEE